MYYGFFHIHAGLTERKEEYVVYLKEGDAVTNCLQIMGAQSALMAPEGGRALTTAEYDRVLTHLLTLDPAEGVVPPKRGRYTLADRVGRPPAAAST